MDTISTHSFTAILALVGMVIVLAALLSGLIERSNFPQVAVFLALGAVLGPAGLGVLNITLESPILRIVSTLSLALVLFTDAVSLSIREVRRSAGLAMLVLGPGTLSTAALVSLAAWWLLDLPVAGAVIVGAALASTDPVLLRGLLRRPDIPTPARQALRLESGLNDVVLLPIVLVAMAFLQDDAPSTGGAWARLGLDLFLLGPGAGVLVGLLGVSTLDLVRRKIGIRRDYESLYSLGIAFAAYAAAEAVHGSGFLAAFMAGLTISALDVELCDCFLEYGETTAEMALLFTFVLLGSSLIWSGFQMLTLAVLLFAILTILIRPVTFLASFAPTRVDRRSRFLIAWFGPRGLSSLLLVLLAVFAGVPGSDRMFSLSSVVVVLSVVLHGGTLIFIGKRSDTPSPGTGTLAVHPHVPATTDGDGMAEAAPEAPVKDGANPDAVPDADEEEAGERITFDRMQRLEREGQTVIVLDARSDRTYNDSTQAPGGAVRINANRAVEEATRHRLPRDAWLATLCA